MSAGAHEICMCCLYYYHNLLIRRYWQVITETFSSLVYSGVVAGATVIGLFPCKLMEYLESERPL